MNKYNYLENMTADIIGYISENSEIITEYPDREDLAEALNDQMFCVDSVTGNASGSYTFNSYRAMEYVIDNMDLLDEAMKEFGVESDEIGERFLNGDWEYFDVSIRCYLLPQAIETALDSMNIGEVVTIDHVNRTIKNNTDYCLHVRLMNEDWNKIVDFFFLDPGEVKSYIEPWNKPEHVKEADEATNHLFIERGRYIKPEPLEDKTPDIITKDSENGENSGKTA